MPQTFNDYYQQTLNLNNQENIWALYQQRIKEHTEAWQDLLEQCGLRPTPD
jgi:hypothetical protein